VPEQRQCETCPLVQRCPISTLVAPLREHHPRGQNIVRPLAIRPPVSHAEVFGPREAFTFGLTLFGGGVELFPYVVMALLEMGRRGLGRRIPENAWVRGQFQIEDVQAVDLLSKQTQSVKQADSSQVHIPDLPMTLETASQYAAYLPNEHLTLRFLTPLRLTYKDRATNKSRLAKLPDLATLIARLAERHDALCREYGGAPFGREGHLALQEAAQTIELIANETAWIDLASYSRQKGRATPIGGLVGAATYRGDLKPLLPLLVWGTVLQVGKDTVKGNGLYELVL
jgi:hypothetical protein